MINLQFRSATLADCKSLAALNNVCNPAAWSEKQFQAACHAPYDDIYLAETQSGALVGFIVWQMVGDEAEIHLLATAPEYRRQGIATALLKKMFQAASQRDCARILLEVRVSNHAAQALYAQHGFAHIATRKRYYGGTEDAIIMEKLC